MKFHPKKCKTLHLGYNNERKKYKINGIQIEDVTEEKDLGIIISEDMKQRKHITEIVKRANKLLGMIRRSITCKNIQVIMNLYKSLVRPILDYGSAIWNPYLKQDIIKLEKVQRRATKIISHKKFTIQRKIKKVQPDDPRRTK